MSYNGYLFQFGEFMFPNKYIKYESYDIAPDQKQDLDSFTDGNGVTHRNALEHGKTNISFSTIEMPDEAMNFIISGLRRNYINQRETDANCWYFDPGTGEYREGHFYLDPSLKYSIKKVDDEGRRIFYKEMQWIFIEY